MTGWVAGEEAGAFHRDEACGSWAVTVGCEAPGTSGSMWLWEVGGIIVRRGSGNERDHQQLSLMWARDFAQWSEDSEVLA